MTGLEFLTAVYPLPVGLVAIALAIVIPLRRPDPRFTKMARSRGRARRNG